MLVIHDATPCFFPFPFDLATLPPPFDPDLFFLPPYICANFLRHASCFAEALAMSIT